MTFLIDTHALLWSVIAPQELSAKARTVIHDPANTILVSAASAWEIATKVRLGKLPSAAALEKDFMDIVVTQVGFLMVPITSEVALRAGRLTGSHGDPFDRMIAAQALMDDIPVVSIDAKLDTFGIRRIW